MDAWCALWFWPVQEAALLDGSHEAYARAAEVAAQSGEWTVSAVPAQSAAPARETYEKEDFFGGIEVVEVKSKSERGGSRKEQIRGERRTVIPLASLDDWLDFAESLLGTQDVAADSLVAQFDTLDALERYEDELPEWMGMERFYSLESRYPWAGVARDVAEQQGFFHWELDFAQVFARGGYDLQMGNPPWVRPRWEESPVLAELDPWFALSERSSAAEQRAHKSQALQRDTQGFYLTELSNVIGTIAFLGSPTLYELIPNTQPDLYRAFMCRSWAQLATRGTVGLIHPDSHFKGSNEGPLRRSTYRHLRLHAHFHNRMGVFPEIHANIEFGIHIYGNSQPPNFTHISWLFSPETLTQSFAHDNSGSAPGIKNDGRWDTRPHKSRLIHVDHDVLAQWQKLSGDTSTPTSHTPLLYPVSTHEQGAVSALSKAAVRLGQESPPISRGYDESRALAARTIHWSTHTVNDPNDVIYQGPHLAISNAFNKEPNNPCRNNRDWSPFDLTSLPPERWPSVNFERTQKDSLGGNPGSDSRSIDNFRLAWRAMIPFDTERSLYCALIPPGPDHVSAVHSMALSDNHATVRNAGFWSALPLDYLLRITGRSHLQVVNAYRMPFPERRHPLTRPLLLRALRLNCLTRTYAPLWEELFDPIWPGYENWAYSGWSNLEPLAGRIHEAWEYATPLRTEYERRAALVELDALVAVWLGITPDQLVAIYKSRYPVLSDYESATYFDANGRKIAANHNTYGYGQTKQDYIDLLAHLENPETTPPPAGYTAPFYKADREAEMRAAHAHFQARLDKEIAAGRWTPPGNREA